MSGRFSGKVAIVTGGASGIGEATVRRLHEEGATVVVVDIRPDAISTLVADLSSDHIVGHRVDMLVTAEIETLIATVADRFGAIDVLINNAGIGSFGRITDIDLAHWREVMAIDVEAAMWASRAAMPFLEKARGNIIHVASVAGIAGDYGFAAYNAAKAALINLTRAMALDHAPHVRVNAVSLGLTATPLAVGLTGNSDIMVAWTNALPLGRPADPAEVAAAIAFLASRDASYINGHNLVVDGGGMAHTGLPNFTQILGGASHLASAESLVRREPVPRGSA